MQIQPLVRSGMIGYVKFTSPKVTENNLLHLSVHTCIISEYSLRLSIAQTTALSFIYHACNATRASYCTICWKSWLKMDFNETCAYLFLQPLIDCAVCYKTYAGVIETEPKPYVSCVHKPALTEVCPSHTLHIQLNSQTCYEQNLSSDIKMN